MEGERTLCDNRYRALLTRTVEAVLKGEYCILTTMATGTCANFGTGYQSGERLARGMTAAILAVKHMTHG